MEGIRMESGRIRERGRAGEGLLCRGGRCQILGQKIVRHAWLRATRVELRLSSIHKPLSVRSNQSPNLNWLHLSALSTAVMQSTGLLGDLVAVAARKMSWTQFLVGLLQEYRALIRVSVAYPLCFLDLTRLCQSFDACNHVLLAVVRQEP